ncbi:hypothetical protein [Actinoplanes sp. NPDC048796]|uniref:hypothetical protein n=1 Tax=Actinoplanes sp. NPDC048796 TaxID=3155640 RepID=UPI0033F3BBBE
MVVAVLVILLALMIGVMVSWFRVLPSAPPLPSAPFASPASGPAPALASPSRSPESLEGALAAQLASGAITRPQYLRAMGWLALREQERHPMEPGPI